MTYSHSAGPIEVPTTSFQQPASHLLPRCLRIRPVRVLTSGSKPFVVANLFLGYSAGHVASLNWAYTTEPRKHSPESPAHLYLRLVFPRAYVHAARRVSSLKTHKASESQYFQQWA